MSNLEGLKAGSEVMSHSEELRGAIRLMAWAWWHAWFLSPGSIWDLCVWRVLNDTFQLSNQQEDWALNPLCCVAPVCCVSSSSLHEVWSLPMLSWCYHSSDHSPCLMTLLPPHCFNLCWRVRKTAEKGKEKENRKTQSGLNFLASLSGMAIQLVWGEWGAGLGV